MPARVNVLCTGYAAERVASTVVLVRDGGAVIGPLEQLGVSPDEVTDVVFSHHHPDHTLNAALFARARFHDFWAIYTGDVWTERPADGFELSPAVRLMTTPGHTAQDITTLITTGDGLAVCTHLWWSREGPAIDPLAEDQELLERSRARLLALEPAIIMPGHGTPFAPSELAPEVR